MSSRFEARPNIPGAEPGQVTEPPIHPTQHLPVRPSVRDQEEEVLGRVVSPLEPEPAFKCLQVMEAHLEFDRGASARPDDHCVPGTTIATVGQRRKRYLRSCSERQGGMAEEFADSPRVAGIPEAMPAWIQPERRVEAEDGRNFGDLHDLERLRLAPLDARVAGAVDSSGTSHVRLADAEAASSGGELAPDAQQGSIADETTAIEQSGYRRHGETIARALFGPYSAMARRFVRSSHNCDDRPI